MRLNEYQANLPSQIKRRQSLDCDPGIARALKQSRTVDSLSCTSKLRPLVSGRAITRRMKLSLHSESPLGQAIRSQVSTPGETRIRRSSAPGHAWGLSTIRHDSAMSTRAHLSAIASFSTNADPTGHYGAHDVKPQPSNTVQRRCRLAAASR